MNKLITRTTDEHLTELLDVATSALARASSDPYVWCDFRHTAGHALEEAWFIIERQPGLPGRDAWLAIIRDRFMEFPSTQAA